MAVIDCSVSGLPSDDSFLPWNCSDLTMRFDERNLPRNVTLLRCDQLRSNTWHQQSHKPVVALSCQYKCGILLSHQLYHRLIVSSN